MNHHKMVKSAEFLDSHRTVIFGNINLIISWFGSSGQIRYISGLYPAINFCYPITHDEFKQMYSLYEGYNNNTEQQTEIQQLKELKLKYPHE